MKTVLIGICSILFLSSLFFLFNRLLKHSRRKSSLYLHSSELEPTLSSIVAEPEKKTGPDADMIWKD